MYGWICIGGGVAFARPAPKITTDKLAAFSTTVSRMEAYKFELGGRLHVCLY
jgi:hypothetical protein